MTKIIPAAMLIAASLSACPAQAGSSVRYAVTDKISGPDGGWDFAEVDPTKGMLYIARADTVTAVDLANRKVADRLGVAHHGHQVLALPDHATLLVTNGDTDTASFLSATTGEVLKDVAVGKKPDAAFLDPATGLIAVMNADDGTVSLIDPATRALVGAIQVGGALEFGVSDGHGEAYVNIEDANIIAVLDMKARRQIGKIALPGCEGPTGLALVAGGKRLISACANGKALVIDPATGKTLATLAIGADPDAVLADEVRHLAFIPCGGSGTLVAIDTSNPDHVTIAQTIPTQVGAKTGAIDPRDGRIYLPTATLAKAEPGAKRGKPVPGTFVVLVVAPKS